MSALRTSPGFELLAEAALDILDARALDWRTLPSAHRRIVIAGAVWWAWRDRWQGITQHEASRAVVDALVLWNGEDAEAALDSVFDGNGT